MNKSIQKYYIQEHSHRKPVHGGVGNVDIEKTLDTMGFIPIRLPYHFTHSVFAKIARLIEVWKWLRRIPAGSRIAFQHPLYAQLNRKLILKLCKRKDVQVICLVLDIDGLKDGNEALLSREISLLSKCSSFVVHNDAMQTWMHSQNITGSYSQLEFFDFLAPMALARRMKSNKIAFAGNLAKSGFLEQLSLIRNIDKLQFIIYGPGRTANMPDSASINYMGIVAPYDLPKTVEGSFGLVWDGESIDGEGGSIGSYMQYITHHKISLYILSGLPVIIYKNAGAAYLIERYNIGITVASLHELSDRINAIDEFQYSEMIRNCNQLAKSISSGKHTYLAIKKLIDEN